MLQVRPREFGVLQPPPLPVVVELGENCSLPHEELRQKITAEMRSRLLVTTDVHLVPYGTLPRETYKSKLIDYSDAETARTASG
jgi:phenylacetate-CoA ligase